MEKNKMDLTARMYVLELALKLEDVMSNLMKLFVGIYNPKPKTISNHASALSFKGKVDLFWDLELFDEATLKDLVLLMEIRNQFMHNIKCNTFLELIDIVDTGQKNRLIKVDPLYDEKKIITEEYVKSCYTKLVNKSNKTIYGIIDAKIAVMKKMSTEFNKPYEYLIKVYTDTLAFTNDLISLIDVKEKEEKEMLKFKKGLVEKIGKFTDELNGNDNLKNAIDNFRNSNLRDSIAKPLHKIKSPAK